MKQIATGLLALFLSCVSQAVEIKPITQINDINKVGEEYYSKQVSWFQGDSIKFDVYARNVRAPIDFTGQAFPVLFVTAETNRQLVYMAQTGTVVNATNGHVSVTVPASGATLDTNQSYTAWMIVFRESGGVTAEVATVAYSQAQVLPSPLGVTYTNVQPITNFYIDVDGILSEYDPVFTASVAYAITSGMTSQWTQAYNWGDASTQNLGKGWSRYPATQDVNFAQYYATNLGGVHLDLTPSGSIAPGRMQWNPDMETVRLGLDAAVSLDVGQQQVAFVRNAESATISNGTVVYISGATGDKATVKVASYSNDTLSARTIGIAAEDIVSGGTGFVVTRGPVYAQKTDTFTQGAMLYLGAYGNVTTNRPSAPLHGVFVGVVEKVNANAGVIYVAVQNGFEMDELHDVNVASVTSGQVLQYNGTVWTNANAAYLPLAGGTMATEAVINMSEGTISNINYIGWFGGAEGYIGFEEKRIEGSAWAFAQQPTIPGYLTTALAASTYATGAPLYEVDLSPYATGTPIYSVAGLATGTPLYTFSESDPVWVAERSNYATGTPIYSVAGLATGTPLYEVDLSPYATGTPIYSVAGLATGTPLYSFTESDPIWLSEKSNYATGTPIYSVSGLATGTPLYAEVDPVWGAASNLYATTASVSATYLPLAGGTLSGSLDINANNIDGVSTLNFSTGASFEEASGSNLTFRGKMDGLVLSDGLSFSSQQSKIAHTEGGSPYIEINDDVIYYGGIHEFVTNATVRVYGKSQITDIDELVASNANLGLIRLSDSNNKGALVGSSGSVSTVYIRPSDTNEIIGIRGGRLVIRNASDAVAFIIAPDGIYDENGNQIFNPSGKISQTVSETATLGIVTAQTVTANSFIGSFTGDGSSITNLTLTGYGLATGTPLYVETDPIWTSASSLYYTAAQVDSAFATGTPIYSLAGYATGTPLYTFTETDPIWTAASTNYYTSSQADALFATGAPLYSVDLSAYATGSPLYVYTETDSIATNLLTNYYTASQADALFATGAPLYSVDLTSYLTSTGAAAIYLPLNGGTVTGSITMSGDNNIFITNSFSGGNAIQATMNGSAGYEGLLINDNGLVGGSYLVFKRNGTNEYTFDNSLANFHGNKITNAVVDGYLTSTGAVATYLGITSFNASSNAINARLVAVEGYTNRADAALDSNTWASADSTTNYASRLAFNNFTNAYSIGAWSSFAATQTVNLGQQNLTNAATITRATNSINFNAGTLGGSWTFNSQPSIPGYLTTNGSAANLVSFPSSLLTVSAGNTNYLRHTTANPTNATYSGQWNQFTYTYRDATSIIMKVYGPSNKWYGIVLNELPIE